MHKPIQRQGTACLQRVGALHFRGPTPQCRYQGTIIVCIAAQWAPESDMTSGINHGWNPASRCRSQSQGTSKSSDTMLLCCLEIFSHLLGGGQLL